MDSTSANPEPLRRELPTTVWVADVLRPHGIRGEVKIAIHSDVPGRFDPGSELLRVGPQSTSAKAENAGVESAGTASVRVVSFRPVRGGGVVRFEGCDNRDQAERLRGCRLEVERQRSPRPPEGSYYFWQLTGCRCFDAEAGELGEVVDLIEDGGGVLLRVAGGGREVLVPFVDAFLERIDVAGGRIDLRLPPGLVETCTSKS